MTATESEILDAVSDVVRLALRLGPEASQLGPDTPLTAFGLDSLNIIDVLLGIEQRFNLSFDDADLDLTVFDTVRSLSGFVHARLG